MLVLLGSVLNISVGNLFISALLPGITLVFLYLVYIGIITYFSPSSAPAMPSEMIKEFKEKTSIRNIINAFLLPFILIFAVLGSIFMGIASPTEAAGIGAAGADIRQFRQSVVESQNDNHKKFVLANDFFNLSMVRDLIFHVQEHRFTLPRVQSHLTELGLKFCGFENNDAVAQFRLAFGREGDLYDLKLWHELEEDNPDMFAGMYQFWCQKT